MDHTRDIEEARRLMARAKAELDAIVAEHGARAAEQPKGSPPIQRDRTRRS